MAAFLLASSRICRQLVLCTTRNPRSLLIPRCMLEKRPVFPHFVSARRIFDGNPEEMESYLESKMQETDHEERSDFHEGKSDLQNANTSTRKGVMGSMLYQRFLKRIGVIASKKTLLELFDNIFKTEGEVTKLQAYQFLRNCSTELLRESPESRIDTVHIIWDKLIGSGMEVDIMMYNALLSAYVQNGYNFDPYKLLEKIQSIGLEPNSITIILLLQAYGERGDMEGVFKLLEFMKEVDMTVTEPVYSSLIMGYWRSGDIESARGVLDTMRENGLEPKHESYTTLLKVYAEKGNLEAIDELIIEMQENKIYPDRRVYLALLEVFGKLNNIDLISKILQKPTVKRLVEGDLFNLMLSFTRTGHIDVALTIKSFLAKENYTSSKSPHHYMLLNVVQSKQPVDIVMKVIKDINEEGVMRDVFERALDASYFNLDPELSIALIKEMLAKGVVVKEHYFYPILASYGKTKNSKDTLATLTLMAENGFEIDDVSMRYVVESIGQPQDSDVASFLNLYPEDNIVAPMLVKAITQVVMETGNLDKLEVIFNYLAKNDMVTSIIPEAFKSAMKRAFDPYLAFQILQVLNIRGFDKQLLSKYVTDILDYISKSYSKERVLQAAELIKMMLKGGMMDLLRPISYNFITSKLNSYLLHHDIENLLQVMKEARVPLNHQQQHQMLRMYGYQGNRKDAEFYFDKITELQQQNRYSYSHLISAYGKSESGFFNLSNIDHAVARRIVQLYEEMKELKFEPLRKAVNFIMLSYISLGNLQEAENLKRQFGDLPLTNNIEMMFLKEYANMRDTENTMKYFEAIKNSAVMHSSPYAYSLAIGAFTGDIDSQRHLLKEMEEMGFTPSKYSYEALLDTYFLNDDIDGALQVLEEAKAKNTYPSHHGCVKLAYLCGKHCPKKLEEVLSDMLDHHKAQVVDNRKDSFFCSLAFVCAVSGYRNLEEKIWMMMPVNVNFDYRGTAFIFASIGDVEVIHKIKEYVKERNLEIPNTVHPLIRAYERKNDPDGVMEVYNSYVASGGVVWPYLKETVVNILKKHGREVPFAVTKERWPRKGGENMISTSGYMDDLDSSDFDDSDGYPSQK